MGFCQWGSAVQQGCCTAQSVANTLLLCSAHQCMRFARCKSAHATAVAPFFDLRVPVTHTTSTQSCQARANHPSWLTTTCTPCCLLWAKCSKIGCDVGGWGGFCHWLKLCHSHWCPMPPFCPCGCCPAKRCCLKFLSSCFCSLSLGLGCGRKLGSRARIWGGAGCNLNSMPSVWLRHHKAPPLPCVKQNAVRP